MSAASRAAVYFAICCLMASVAALTSSALLRDDPHDTVGKRDCSLLAVMLACWVEKTIGSVLSQVRESRIRF